MKPLLAALLPLALVALGACSDAGGGSIGGAPSADNDLCLASTWRARFVGASRDQANFEIGPLIREGKARIVDAGQARFERPDRLTFEMGRDNRVSRITCG